MFTCSLCYLPMCYSLCAIFLSDNVPPLSFGSAIANLYFLCLWLVLLMYNNDTSIVRRCECLTLGLITYHRSLGSGTCSLTEGAGVALRRRFSSSIAFDKLYKHEQNKEWNKTWRLVECKWCEYREWSGLGWPSLDILVHRVVSREKFGWVHWGCGMGKDGRCPSPDDYRVWECRKLPARSGGSPGRKRLFGTFWIPQNVSGGQKIPYFTSTSTTETAQLCWNIVENFGGMSMSGGVGWSRKLSR